MTRFGGGVRIVYGFLPDVKEEAYGWFTDFYRIWGGRLRISYGFFLPDVEDESYGFLPDFYRIWGRRLPDCVRFFAGFGGGGLWIVYEF